jgi:hypothetical protein
MNVKKPLPRAFLYMMLVFGAEIAFQLLLLMIDA